jgi:hypothetical protein
MKGKCLPRNGSETKRNKKWGKTENTYNGLSEDRQRDKTCTEVMDLKLLGERKGLKSMLDPLKGK